MMFRAWRAERLITKLTGLKAKNNRLNELISAIESMPAHYMDKSLKLTQQIAELEFKIEMLKDGK